MPNRIDVLFEALDSFDEAQRRFAVDSLARLGREVVPQLMRWLASERCRTRCGAIEALEKVHATECLPALRECLTDPVREVRHSAIVALGRFQDVDAVDMLHRELQHGRRDLRPAVIEALGRIGDASSAPLLWQLLDERDCPASHHPQLLAALATTDCLAVAPALCRFGARHHGATLRLVEEVLAETGAAGVALLISQLHSRTESSGPAAGALYRMGVTAFGLLSHASESPLSIVRVRARAIFAAQGRCEISWISDLITGVAEGPDRVRMLAAEGLAMLADREGCAELRSSLPALRQASRFWNASPSPVLNALRQAISRIESATAVLSQMPVPASTPGEARHSLPLVSGVVPLEGPFPLPALGEPQVAGDSELLPGVPNAPR